jgi:PAS domain S-box-containing protein
MKKPLHAVRSSAEDSLHRSHHTFEDFFNKVNTAVSVFEMRDNGVPGRYLEVNNTLCQWLGYTRKELLALSPLDISEKVDAGVTGAAADTSTNKGYSVIERTLIAKDGRRIPIEANLHYITYAGKKAVFSISRDISEREETFSKAFRASPMPMIISTPADGKVMDFNDEFERFSGWTRPEAVGRTTLELGLFAHPEDREVALDILQKEGHLRNFKLALRAKSGDPLTFLWSTEKINLGGEPRLLSTLHDVTAREKAEESLRESEERYRLLHEYAPIGILLVNRSGQILEVNSAAIQSLGSPSAEATKAINFLTFPLLIEAGISAAFQRCVETGQVVSGEYPYITKWGKSLHMLLRFVPIFDDHHQVNLVHAISENITERKQAEEALRQSNENRSLIFKTSPDAICITRLADGTFLEINQAFTDITGYTPEELLGFSSLPPSGVALWTKGEDRDRMVTELKTKGEVISMEMALRIKNGTIRTSLLSARILEINGEKCILTIAHDITERNKMIVELQNAQKLESLGILAGGVAHDFNNLLTGIFGFIDLARSVSKDGMAVEYLGAALATMNRARALTQQLLTFSKGGAPVKRILSLQPLLTSTTNFVLSGSTVNARFCLPENLWLCEVDENQFCQVIDNIVINARQAMPTGGTVVVMAENIPPGEAIPAPLAPGAYVHISIHDFGIGIAREHLPRIFDPFFTTKQQGSGLGLATVYSIIKKHEGFIEAESELGTGTTVHVYLPATPSAAVETPITGVKMHRGQGTVLVMDDEDCVRKVLCEWLKSMGYSVDFAANGNEAVEKYAKAFASPLPFRAVILDLTLPGGMGGKETLAELLKINPAIIAIAASGYSNDPIMTDPVAFGFKGKIRKPFTKEELGDVLERVVGISK